MKRYYFVKDEQIHKGGKPMIIMDIKADNLYAFKNFHMNMSYPKKIVDSTIEGEFLKNRTNFRYKKVNIIMGANATGKTSIGKLLMGFANFFEDGNVARFLKIVDDKRKNASLSIDFVTDEDLLYRFSVFFTPESTSEYNSIGNVFVDIFCTEINKRDNYEICAKRLDKLDCREVSYEEVDTSGWTFLYPQDVRRTKEYQYIENNEKYLYILEQTLKTLDPSIKKVVRLKEVDNAYAIKFQNHDVIIKDGRIADEDVLSSGTKAGLDISYVIAALICDKHDLYFCDELFPFVHSELEKVCLSIIIEKLTDRKQLFFTTHNTDILDMQLPRHAFTFLKKNVSDQERPIQCINAAQVIKRNTDSLKHAVENDLFGTSPDVDRLYQLADI